MTKTIIIGDLHLQAGLILPSILKTAKQKKVNNIVLLGDYVALITFLSNF